MRFAAYTSLHQALETLDSLRGLSEELREGDPTGNEGADFTDFPSPPHPSV